MFSWRDYLSLAAYLAQTADQTAFPEAARRSSVSRAYYSAFCLVREWASARPMNRFVPARSGADHPRLRDWLKNAQLPNVALELEQLHVWRKQCDYDNPHGLPLDRVCQQALNRASRVLRDLGIV